MQMLPAGHEPPAPYHVHLRQSGTDLASVPGNRGLIDSLNLFICVSFSDHLVRSKAIHLSPLCWRQPTRSVISRMTDSTRHQAVCR